MINVITKLLQSNKYSEYIVIFKENYTSHPDYPSLYSATNTLDFIDIQNIAGRFDKTDFDKIPSRFIAQLTNNEFVFVEKKHGKIFCINEFNLKVKFTVADFLETKWTGLAIIIEENKTLNEKIYIFKMLFVSMFLFLLVYNHENIFKIAPVLLGLYISFLIHQQSIGNLTTVSKKVCEKNDINNCDLVINSNFLNKIIKISILPFSFFLASFILSLIDIKFIETVYFFGLISMPFVFYLIYIQFFILKKVCKLCLIISLIMFYLAIMKCIGFISNFSYKPVVVFSFLFFLITFLWNSYEENLKLYIFQKKEFLELQRFKRNRETFKLLSEKLINPEVLNTLDIITLNRDNKVYNNTLFLILSPTCGYCHLAFAEAISLINSFENDLKINIMFNVNPKNTNNQYVKIIQRLIEIYKYEKEIFEAISDLHKSQMEVDKWIDKWGNCNRYDETFEVINEHFKWCAVNNISYTPAMILNEKKIPNIYNVKELILFL